MAKKNDESRVKNVCHYACSTLSYTNIIIIIAVFFLIYHIITNNILQIKNKT